MKKIIISCSDIENLKATLLRDIHYLKHTKLDFKVDTVKYEITVIESDVKFIYMTSKQLTDYLAVAKNKNKMENIKIKKFYNYYKIDEEV